jgi:hypothetical protein
VAQRSTRNDGITCELKVGEAQGPRRGAALAWARYADRAGSCRRWSWRLARDAITMYSSVASGTRRSRGRRSRRTVVGSGAPELLHGTGRRPPLAGDPRRLRAILLRAAGPVHGHPGYQCARLAPGRGGRTCTAESRDRSQAEPRTRGLVMASCAHRALPLEGVTVPGRVRMPDGGLSVNLMLAELVRREPRIRPRGRASARTLPPRSRRAGSPRFA